MHISYLSSHNKLVQNSSISPQTLLSYIVSEDQDSGNGLAVILAQSLS